MCNVCGAGGAGGGATCSNCLARTGAAGLDGSSIFLMHATTGAAGVAIQREGFKLRALPRAGRALGDVVYSYAYDGGSLHGAITHAINGAEEEARNGRPADFVVLRVRPPPGNYLVLSNAHVENAPGGNYFNAFLREYANDPIAVAATRRAKADRLKFVRETPVGRKMTRAKEARDAVLEELDRLTAASRQASQRDRPDYFEAMRLQVEALSAIEAEQERYVEHDLSEIDVVNAARALGIDGYYNTSTRVVALFNLAALQVEPFIPLTPIPEGLIRVNIMDKVSTPLPEAERIVLADRLKAAIEPIGARAFAAFLNEPLRAAASSSSSSSSSSSTSTSIATVALPPAIAGMGDLASGITPCMASAVSNDNDDDDG